MGKSLESIVGKKTYSVWVEMLQKLVPDGRTHRLAPLIGGMLQYSSEVAYKKYGSEPKNGTLAHYLFSAQGGERDEDFSELADVVEKLFKDASVSHGRTDHRGNEYDIVESAIQEYINWHNMPWESY